MKTTGPRMRWLRFAGYIIAVLATVWTSAKTIVDWLGRVDFVVSHRAELGRLGVALEYVVAPPWWLPWSVLAFGLAIIWADSRRAIKATAEAHIQSDSGLVFECHLAELPAKVSPEGLIYTLPLSYAPGSPDNPIGLAMRRGQPGGDWNWSYERRSPQIYRCEITNYGSAPLLQIGMLFRIEYLEVAASDSNPLVKTSKSVVHSYEWPVLISKIDPGKQNAVCFYVHNQSAYLAHVIPPEKARYIPLGGGSNKEVSLLRIGMLASMSLWPAELI
jgi:hypothetical protein